MISRLILMASVAIWFLVSAVELEFGTLVVIEIPGLPRSCVMACLAFLTQPTLVHLVIILFMA